MTAPPVSLLGTSDRWLRSALPESFVVNRWVEAAALAAIFGAVVLIPMASRTLRRSVREARRQMLADAYAILLYRRSPRMVIRAELKLIRDNFRLLAWLSPSVLVGSLLFLLVYNALDERYASAPLPTGADVVVRVREADGPNVDPTDAAVVPNDGEALTVTARVRVPAVRTVWTRLRPARPGVFRFQTGPNGGHEASVNVATPSAPARPVQYAGAAEVYVAYPRDRHWGLSGGWATYFAIMSLAAAAVFARVLKLRM